MNRNKNDIRVDFTFIQLTEYYWWAIFWWTLALIGFVSGLYIQFFTTPKGKIEYIFYSGLVLFIIGTIGFFLRKRDLNFKNINNRLNQSDNYDIAIKAIRELGWRQIKIRKFKIIVSEKGHDIIPGQIITIIPNDNEILFNCIITSYRLTDSSNRTENFNKFKQKIEEFTKLRIDNEYK